jgi:cytochrome P450
VTNAAREVAVEYDPFDGMLLGDPYELYAALRASAPVYFSRRRDFWALTRYEDILPAMRDWETFSAARGVDIDDTGAAYGSGDFLGEDPPVHDVLRDVVRSHFVPKHLRAEMTEFIRAEVRRLLAKAWSAGPLDLAAELAWPLPVAVGTELLGIPASDRELLLALQRRLAERTPGVRELPPDACSAGAELRSYFAELIRSRRARPEDDLVTAISRAKPEGKPIGEDAVGMLFLLFVASMETTASSIANALAMLAGHPDQRSRLAGDLASVDQAVEEVLRFEAPVQVTKRVATREVVVRGATIPAGADVFLVLASANRDEQRYERPDDFDVRREPLRHLAFGDGIHHCLGAPLARLELRILLEELCEAGASVTLEGPARRLNSHFIRGYAELPGALS